MFKKITKKITKDFMEENVERHLPVVFCFLAVVLTLVISDKPAKAVTTPTITIINNYYIYKGGN